MSEFSSSAPHLLNRRRLIALGAASAVAGLSSRRAQAQLKLDLPPTKLIEPKPGRLALFPSWMWHGTRPFGQGERLTVAFDVARGA